MLDTGRHPRMGFEPRQPASHLEEVNDFTKRMQDALQEAKDDMALYYNRCHSPAPVYKPGDKVWLDASDIKTTRPSQKLSEKRLGPFSILKQVSPNAYHLKLPAAFKRLHPVFNIVKLTPYEPDPIPGRSSSPPPLPMLIDGEEE